MFDVHRGPMPLATRFEAPGKRAPNIFITRIRHVDHRINRVLQLLRRSILHLPNTKMQIDLGLDVNGKYWVRQRFGPAHWRTWTRIPRYRNFNTRPVHRSPHSRFDVEEVRCLNYGFLAGFQGCPLILLHTPTASGLEATDCTEEQSKQS
jgi:hypothetical protein